VVFSRRVGGRQLIAEEIVKLEIWPSGSKALTQLKLLRPIGVAVFTSYRDDADNLFDNENQGYTYIRRSKDSISTYNAMETLHNVARDGPGGGCNGASDALKKKAMHSKRLLHRVT
jgi:hypothetical protein